MERLQCILGIVAILTIGVAENTSGATRVGTLTFTTLAGDIERTFVITQAGTLTLSETEHVNTSQDQDRTFTVFAADDCGLGLGQ